MADRAQFLSFLEEILEAPGGSVAFESDLEELGWDSLSDLGFIAGVDERFGKTVDPERLAESETPNDLYTLVFG
ncbi:acyl carrier protein [Herbiconiux sp. L3-i23]|uniref:acyl carrier protein n=1 Tax=Herbiconiux sp. L3-i23 TaxID=2905871 RepID=UPI00204FAF52|nr:acyl carrier protein [Herbiconiux sp. L3-i23]BDI21646.1 hypothetical protein L3i23_04220 [Herbiconiux sp. L3-i23]